MTRAIPITEDLRPPRFGWAPGDYVNHCTICKEQFIGAKRAYNCAPCAYGLPDRVTEPMRFADPKEQIARLRAALEPFAKHGAAIPARGVREKYDSFLHDSLEDDYPLLVEDFRRALAVWKESK